MEEITCSNVKALLHAHSQGDPAAFDRLFEAVYDELCRAARAQKLRRSGTLDTVELVHELYLKLGAGDASLGIDREHFHAIAARAMRHLLVDRARAAGWSKRGGGARRVTRAFLEQAGPREFSIDPTTAARAAALKIPPDHGAGPPISRAARSIETPRPAGTPAATAESAA